MSDDRSEYDVVIGGITHRMLLSSHDAKRYGESATRADSKAKAAPNKARSVSNKEK